MRFHDYHVMIQVRNQEITQRDRHRIEALELYRDRVWERRADQRFLLMYRLRNVLHRIHPGLARLAHKA